MSRVVCLGSVLQDIYMIDHNDLGEIKTGEKLTIDKNSFEVGGGAVNAATNFARHGHETIVISNFGRDSAANAILNFLQNENVDTSYLNFTRKKTGISVIMLDSETGKRTILTCRGASESFTKLEASDLDLSNPDWLYVTSLNGDMNTCLRFFEKAKEKGIKIMWNPGMEEIAEKKKLLGLLQDVDVLILNEKEAKTLIGGEILEELLVKLARYVKTVIITAGARGSIATNGKETYRLAEYEMKTPKDTTGAGDAFGAGFLSATLDGKKFKDALIFAAANATSVISYIGAQAGTLYGDEDLHPMPIQRL